MYFCCLVYSFYKSYYYKAGFLNGSGKYVNWWCLGGSKTNPNKSLYSNFVNGQMVIVLLTPFFLLDAPVSPGRDVWEQFFPSLYQQTGQYKSLHSPAVPTACYSITCKHTLRKHHPSQNSALTQCRLSMALCVSRSSFLKLASLEWFIYLV